VVEILDCCKHLKLPAEIEVRCCVLHALGFSGVPVGLRAGTQPAAARALTASHANEFHRMRAPPPASCPQDKQYPRDWWMSRGRLRVQLFNEDGTPTNPEVPTRELDGDDSGWLVGFGGSVRMQLVEYCNNVPTAAPLVPPPTHYSCCALHHNALLGDRSCAAAQGC